MKGLIYIKGNNVAIFRNEDSVGITREQVQKSSMYDVARELLENKDMFLCFGRIAVQDVPWQKVKEEYSKFLPSSLFTLEGMWNKCDRDSIITGIQEILQDFGCERIKKHVMYTEYGLMDVIFGRVFSPKEDVDEDDPKSSGYSEEMVSSAKKLYQIAKLFDVVDNWADSKHCNEKTKLEIVTKMVNTMSDF